MALGPKPNHLEAYATIIIDGQDMTPQWDSRLISLTITDPLIGQDEANIELDDSMSGAWPSGKEAGWLLLPRLGRSVAISLGWKDDDDSTFKLFTGWVHDIESAGQRRSGRVLTVLARSGLATGKQQGSKMFGAEAEKTSGGGGFAEGGGVTLASMMQEAAKDAGYTTMNVDPKIGQIKERNWSQDNESFHQFGERIARAYGGIFKVAGDGAGIASANGNTDALGKPGNTFTATIGENVLSWRIKPFVHRPKYGEAMSHWFDRTKGIMKRANFDIPQGGDAWQGVNTVFTSLFTQASDTQAQNQAEAQGGSSNRSQAQGWVVLEGLPRIKAKDYLVLKGFRPGVDGRYTVQQVEHQYSRRTGYITRCDLQEPFKTSKDQGEPLFLTGPQEDRPPQAGNPPGGV